MKSDFLAIILIMTGSSYARGPDKEDCISRVSKTFVSDWSSLFDVAGKEATVGVYDVTGHESLYWDARGVWVNNPDGEDFLIQPLELRKVTLPTKHRR